MTENGPGLRVDASADCSGNATRDVKTCTTPPMTSGRRAPRPLRRPNPARRGNEYPTPTRQRRRRHHYPPGRDGGGDQYGPAIRRILRLRPPPRRAKHRHSDATVPRSPRIDASHAEWATNSRNFDRAKVDGAGQRGVEVRDLTIKNLHLENAASQAHMAASRTSRLEADGVPGLHSARIRGTRIRPDPRCRTATRRATPNNTTGSTRRGGRAF